jgi:arylsulfatase
MKYSFDAKPDAPTQKHIQYYTMIGTRAIWQDGWKAVAVHAPLTDVGKFDQDKWELYHTDVDRAESVDLAKKFPEKLEDLKKLYLEEAIKNQALPLDDRTAMAILSTERPTEEAPRDSYTYYPHTSQVPEAVAVNVRGKSFKIVANVEIKADAKGVIFAHGSRFGGHSLFIKDHKLYYVYNFLGITQQQLVSTETLKPGKYTFGMEFTKEKAGEHHESIGTANLYVNDKQVATGSMKAQVGKFTLVGDGLCVGWDSGDPVSKLYSSPGEFEDGTISFVTVSTGKEQYLDLEREAARAFSKE